MENLIWVLGHHRRERAGDDVSELGDRELNGEVPVLYGDMELYLQRGCVPNRAEILSDGE
jgi:hypothetical protein